MNVNKFVEKINKVDEKNVELSSMKVELGLLQDLESMYKEAQKDWGKARAMGRELKGVYAKMVEDLRETEKATVGAYTKFKELGIKDTSELDDIARRISRDIKGIEGLAKAIATLG